MADNPSPSDGRRDVHLLDYWRTVWRSRWTVVSIFVVVVTLVAIGTFTQPPIYRARATVEITPQSRKVSPLADVSEMGTSNYGWFAEERYFNTQYEIIKSRDVSKRVFDRLDLYSLPQFRDSNDPLGAFAQMIQVQPIKDTGIVEISLEGPNAKEVADWVNATAEEYTKRNLDQAVQATSKAVKALLREMDPLRARLQDTQEASYEFAARTNLFVPENQQKMTNDRLSTLQAELTQAQVRRASLESLLKEIDTVRARGGAYETIPEIGNDPVVRTLIQERATLEREYEKLLVTYKERHVRVLERQSEIEKTNQKIASEADRIASGLKTELALLKDREGSLAQSINDTKADSMRMSQKASSYELVRGDVTETKRIYDMISTRIKEIDLSADLLSNNLRILDAAPIPKVPVKPRTMLNLAVGILLGLLLGVGTVFFMDYMDNTIRTSEDVEHFLRLSLLAVVPKETTDTGHAVREAYQTLRTSLLFSRKARGSNVLLITSAGPQEGKSCTTVNVARVLAQSGEKVVVLDCDLRRPTVHQRLNLDRDLGVTNYILSSDGDDWRAYVKPSGQANLFAMTSGPIPPNPADVFGHERFAALLKELRHRFDWVLIDSPPAVSLTDATILASIADMVAFVIKHNENDRDLIRRCVANLRKVTPHLIGAILNNVDLARSDYRDYYYVGYYYGESGKKKNRKRQTPTTIGTLVDEDADNRITRSAG